MNTKTTALLMALTMVIAATAVVAAVDGSDAADVNINKDRDVYVKVGATATFDIKITEPDKSYYDNVVTWTINDANVPKVDAGSDAPKSPATIGSSIATIYISESDGTYTAHISGVSAGDAKGLELVYKVSTTIKTEETGAVEQTIKYALNVYVLTIPLSETVKNDFTMTYGKSFDRTAVFTSDAPNSEYVYFAIGLPDGVQMAPDGYISGTPVKNSNDDTYNVTVVATHKVSNQSFICDYKMNVIVPTDTDFTFKVGGAVKVTDNGEYIVLQNGKVTLTVSNATKSFKAYIYKTSTDNSTEGLTDLIVENDVSKEINTNGSGKFTIMMIDGNQKDSISLTVVAISQDVETGIGFAPGFTVSVTPSTS